MVGCTIFRESSSETQHIPFPVLSPSQAIFRLKLAQRYIPQYNSLMEVMLFLVSFRESVTGGGKRTRLVSSGSHSWSLQGWFSQQLLVQSQRVQCQCILCTPQAGRRLWSTGHQLHQASVACCGKNRKGREGL